ncbi:MAG: cupin superfamily protein-domain-containing protein [Monoraphidium minutum]|nr:MAG: cupin superfamily protein-domain-containing protein [Monoraphidium minutum]
MGKKSEKAAKASAKGDQIPWKEIDRDPVGFLVAPEKASTFFAECWERAPRVFKATPARAALARCLTTLPSLLAWLRDQEAVAGGGSPLLFGTDVNAARYTGGVRETPNGVGPAGSAALQALHDQGGCTLQARGRAGCIHQPQRWEDDTWRLLAALEASLGSLVGANAYLTPPGTQGLAPHHDDVELWVLQTAGSKAWRCYAPLDGFELPNASSGNLTQDVLGPPVLEVTLEPGDVLYMPRGTVHQAVAAAAGGVGSAHVTISTYQRSSYADLAMHLIGSALRAGGADPDRAPPLSARRGPPPGLAAAHSLHRVLAAPRGQGPTPRVVAGLAGALRDVAAQLEAHPDGLTPAVHAASADYWGNRLPPHPDQLAPQGAAPEMGDRIWCRAAPWCCLVPHDGPAGGGDACGGEGGEGGEGGGLEAVKLVTCLHNVREVHMMNDGGGDDSGSESDDGDEDGSGSEGSGEEGGSGSGSEGEGAPRMKGKAAAAAAKAQQRAGSGGGEEHAAGEGAAAAAAGGEHDCCHKPGCVHTHGDGEGSSDEEDEDEDEGQAPQGEGAAALPGMVFPGGETLRALVAVLNADSPDKAVPISSLPLAHDAEKLHLAFALWAEGFAGALRGGGGGGGGGAGGAKAKGKAKSGGGADSAPAAKKAKK